MQDISDDKTKNNAAYQRALERGQEIARKLGPPPPGLCDYLNERRGIVDLIDTLSPATIAIDPNHPETTSDEIALLRAHPRAWRLLQGGKPTPTVVILRSELERRRRNIAIVRANYCADAAKRLEKQLVEDMSNSVVRLWTR